MHPCPCSDLSQAKKVCGLKSVSESEEKGQLYLIIPQATSHIPMCKGEGERLGQASPG
jgi:hypothetical protein